MQLNRLTFLKGFFFFGNLTQLRLCKQKKFM